MLITKRELIEMNACEDGLDRFLEQTGNTEAPVDVATLVGGRNTYSDLLWLAEEKVPKDRIVRFACDCALINIELIKPYTDKYEEIVEFFNNPTEDNINNVYLDIHEAYSSVNLTTEFGSVDRYAVISAIEAFRNYHFKWAGWTSALVSCTTKAAAIISPDSRDIVNKLLIEVFNEY